MDKKKDIKIAVIISVIVLCLISIACYNFEVNKVAYGCNSSKSELETNCTNNVSSIKYGTRISQSFVSQKNNLAIININFYRGTDNINQNDIGGDVTISLEEENGNIIQEKKITYNNIRENSWYGFKIPVQEKSYNKKYILNIKYGDLEEKCTKYFSVRCSDEDIYENGSMYIDGVQADGDICFQELYYYPNDTLLFYIVSFIVVVILGLIMFWIYKHKDMSEEKLFLYIVPIIFLISLILMPTFKNHDEPFHWYRIYDMSKGNLFTQMIGGEPTGLVEKEITDVVKYSNPANIKYRDTIEQFEANISDSSKITPIKMSTTAIYNPIQYLPQTLGVIIAKIFTNNVMLMSYSARLFNMIVSIILLYFAVKLIPYGKKILLVLACIPISVEGFVSMSSDALTIAATFLFIAYVLKLFAEKEVKINSKDKMILFILSIVIALCKIVYLPIVGLLLILPKEKFKSKKEQFLTIGIIMGIAVIANLAWLAISSTYLVTFRGGSSKEQLIKLLLNPIQYLQILFNTINIYGTQYIYGMFGGEPGWNEYLKLYVIVPMTFGMLYLFLSCTDDEIKNKFNKYQTIVIVLIVLAVVALIFTSLYIQWTSVSSDVIKGVQGRYFIPILPLLSIGILSKLKLSNNYDKNLMKKFIGITILIIYVYVFLTLLVSNM